MLNPQDLEKAKAIQLGLQQFERTHLAVESSDSNGNTIYICSHCTVDFPCERMLLFMLIQSLAAMQSMIPTGNMAGIMKRFSGG